MQYKLFYNYQLCFLQGGEVHMKGVGSILKSTKDYCHNNLIEKKKNLKLKSYRDGEERARNKQNKQAMGSKKLTNQEKCGVKERKNLWATDFIYTFFQHSPT